jgi:DNA modification methylase
MKTYLNSSVNIGMGYNGRNRYEGILFMSKGERLMPFDLSVPDVIVARSPCAAKRIHESEKPPELYEQFLRFATRAGDVVLDLFAGTGI